MSEETTKSPASAFMRAPDAIARMDEARALGTHAYTLGVQAVLWGLQWVKAAESLRMCSAPLPQGCERSPYDPLPHAVGVWGHARKLLNANTRLIETPNNETLYSILVVDLDDGPVVIEHPDFGERYFRTSVWDVHSDTHTISQKQDGSHPPPYLLLRTGWKGEIPPGMRTIEVRSRHVQLAPHIAVHGDADLPAVHALQDGLRASRLTAQGAAKIPLARGAPLRPLHRADSGTPEGLLFFEELGETLKDITVREDEIGFARQLEQIGLSLHEGFHAEALDAPVRAALDRAAADGQSIAAWKARALGPAQPGGTWAVVRDVTRLDDWRQRAGVGFGFVWGDLDSEILFPTLRNDAQGRPFDGSHQYRLRFAPGELPPARYWRISMYDIEGFFVNNPIGRYGIGNMAEALVAEADGSLNITIAHAPVPSEPAANWLPCPKEGFFLILRLYQPEQRMYQGEYIVPAVERLD